MKKAVVVFWTCAIVVDGLMACLTIAALSGYQWANNLLGFIIVTMSCLALLACSSTAIDKKPEPESQAQAFFRTPQYQLYHLLTELGFILAFAAAGWFFLAVARLLGDLCIEYARDQRQKAQSGVDA